MKTCYAIDHLVTTFVDGECTPEERATVTTHLYDCAPCRARVAAEATARHLLQAHAAVARVRGVEPAWRPRVWWLGRPARPAHAGRALLLVAVVVMGTFFWYRRADTIAEGVIGDSFCMREHRFTTNGILDTHKCTLGCVRRGADFVLVTSTRVYRIRNQDLPGLSELADTQVKVSGRIRGETISIDRIAVKPQQPAASNIGGISGDHILVASHMTR